MLNVLAITAPIYLLIAVGFLAVRQGVFQRSDMQLLGRLLVLFVLPALVFRAINRYPLSEVLNPGYLFAYGLGSLVLLVLGVAYGRRLRGHGMAASAFIGMGMAASNSVFVGYPILSQVVGSSADIALALCLLVENLLIIPSTLMLADAQSHLPWHQALRRSFTGVLRNPIVLAILAGLATSLLGWRVPAVIDRTLAIAAGAAAPVALFMIGGVLVGQKLQGVRRDLLAVSLGKLVLHPLAILLLLLLVPPLPAPLMLAAIAFAAMPMPAVYPALAQRFGQDGFCATALVIVTAVSFVSLNAWLTVLPDITGWLAART